MFTFDIQVKLPQQGHPKVANNLGFDSTHIVEPQNPRYSKQYEL
jgi:hypothetical protein